AIGGDVAEAYRKALSTDPVSAFGSVVAFNHPVSAACAELLRPNFVEADVAPGFDEGALEILQTKKNLRILVLTTDSLVDGVDFKGVHGGVLAQTRLSAGMQEDAWRVVTERAP